MSILYVVMHMSIREQIVAIVLADISGYTQFMVADELSAIHKQQWISALLEALIAEVHHPLQLQEIEGDALFLYAEHPGDEPAWTQSLTKIREQLDRLFESFRQTLSERRAATQCACGFCASADKLALKVIAHVGRAVLHRIGRRNQVSGSDVILAHRFLKNSIDENEYLLLTHSAYPVLRRPDESDFQSCAEYYEGFGVISAHVRSVAPTLLS